MYRWRNTSFGKPGERSLRSAVRPRHLHRLRPAPPSVRSRHPTVAFRGTQSRPRARPEFLLQWDDELVPLDSGLALFAAFSSAEKTLHVNPGRHAEVPRFEVETSDRFFRRHLGAQASSRL
jgi:hypothetical protein